MVTHLEWSDSIGKRVRSGDWADQAISTAVKIEDELRAGGNDLGLAGGRRENAAQLVDYYMEEAKVVYVVYRVWTAGFQDWLLEQGVSQADLDGELARLATLLAFPDGTPLEREPRWEALGARAGRLAHGIRGYDLSIEAAIDELHGVEEDWRQLHDRMADLMAGHPRLRRQALRRGAARGLLPGDHGAVPPGAVHALRRAVNPYETTLDRNLYISLEAMRAHLVGRDRRGDIEFEEHDDRYVLRFDPCGSGGRIMRGDEIEGTGPRVLAPYEFGVIEEPRDWTWNETGVCHYCAHCNLALSTIPAERWGHPVRTVDPPLWRGEGDPLTVKKCQWTVWKSLEAIPEREYERIGRTKPPLPVIQPGATAPSEGPSR